MGPSEMAEVARLVGESPANRRTFPPFSPTASRRLFSLSPFAAILSLLFLSRRDG